MLFEIIFLAGGCHNGACQLERPLIERRAVKSVLVRVDTEVTREVVRERKVRRFIKRR
jgi:hypothetical protein